MCGIAAIFAYDLSASAVDPGELRAIRDCMKPRGPDGEGEWFDSNRRVGLGHRRLAIIDLSPGGAQPMLLPERQLAIAFNGEIYNYRELRAALEQRGHVFRSTSDTEVLLRLYADRGDAMVNELRGMYAFAIWDGAKRGLFLARDPFGIKPVYFADDGKTFRLASQAKALLAGGQIDTSPEPAGHVGFFLWGHAIEPYTLYRGIRSLPAGTTLWVDQRGPRPPKTFCSITNIFSRAERPAPLQSSISHLPSPDGALRASLVDSVRHHLVADVPVGIFLSSGLDSTTLIALAAEQGGTLRTVTLGFEEYRGTVNDETPLAEAVARQYGAKHQTVWVKRADFQDHVERLFTAMDCPSTDGVNTYFVSLAAAQTSLKVALSGLGGDELFGGYPSFAEIPRAVRMFQRFNASTFQRFNRAFRIVSAPIFKRFTSPKYAGLLEYGGSYSGAYLLRRGMFMPWELPEFLDADFVREGWAELRPLVRLDETLDGIRSPRAKVSCLEMRWYMRNQLLRDSDWAGMAHSLEIRVPLVDVELLRALAPSLVGNKPPTKLDMAATPRSPLPAALLSRPKTGFTIPVRQWLLEQGAGSKEQGGDRGLRGWTKYVYQRFAGTDALVKQGAGSRERGAGSREQGAGSSEQNAGRAPSHLPSPISDLQSAPAACPRLPAPCSKLPASLQILVLVTDAFGGHGGIAKFNRDLLSALAADPAVQEVVALPRLMPESPGELPAKLRYVTTGVGGKLRYIVAVLKAVRQISAFNFQLSDLSKTRSPLQTPISNLPSPASTLPAPRSPLVICGHINLLPIAWLARRLIQKAESRKQKAESGRTESGKQKAEIRNAKNTSPQSAIRNPQSAIESSASLPPAPSSLLLVVHGIDAWQPTHSWLANRLVRRIDGFISVSEFTKQRFLSWTKLDGVRNFILPNCVDLAQFTPGPKNPPLLERYGLRDRTVLLTVARLAAQERYKGIDEVLEILPELAKQIPNLSYLIVGDGNDRERLVNKARSLGLVVRTADNGLVLESAIGNRQSAIEDSLFAAPRSVPPAPQVLFAGWVHDDEIVDHFRLADTFVMPGRGEGFGIVYLEALACGVPVVASTADASGEVLRGCELATLVDPANREEIQTGILRALKMRRGVVPPGIEFFSKQNFDRRCFEVIEAVRPRSAPDQPQNILVFRIGQLGDTIVALPAMWAVRKQFPDARLTLLCDRHAGKKYVLAADLLRGAGIFDHFESYVVDETGGGQLRQPFRVLELLIRLRRRKFDLLVYLAPSNRTPDQVARDRKFFSAAGIKKFIGTRDFPDLPIKIPGQPLAATSSEADLLLARLAADGVAVPEMGKGSLELRLGPAENTEVESWLRELPNDGGRPWVGIGPGSKMPAKRWPEERFEQAVMGLIERHGIWPVVFGGDEDAALGERLLGAWGRGYNAAGALSVRGAAAALERCVVFLGNDTGTMHLAAAMHTPCVAVFSARIHPGSWYPYGVPSRVFRSQIECEGCLLVECVERQNECLKRIAVGPVTSACEEFIRQKLVADLALKTS